MQVVKKNLGPSGLCFIILKKTFLKTAQEGLPSMFSYKNHSKYNSLFNTPNTFAIYAVNLCLSG